MSAPRKPQGRGVADLLSPRRKSENREVLPVFPRGLFKFDTVSLRLRSIWKTTALTGAARHIAQAHLQTLRLTWLKRDGEVRE